MRKFQFVLAGGEQFAQIWQFDCTLGGLDRRQPSRQWIVHPHTRALCQALSGARAACRK